MQEITPHLWFDREAKEVAEFYTSLFPDSKITNITTLHDTPSGSVDVVSFALSGQPFMAISAGPFSGSIRRCRSSLTSIRRETKMHGRTSISYGRNCPKAARHLCLLISTPSASATAGYKINTDSPGNSSSQIPREKKGRLSFRHSCLLAKSVVRPRSQPTSTCRCSRTQGVGSLPATPRVWNRTKKGRSCSPTL